MSFIGRSSELTELENLYEQDRSSLIVGYGRRRVGKSTLFEKYMCKKQHFKFEGLERVSTKEQLKHISADLSDQVDDPLLKEAAFKTWRSFLDYMTKIFEKSEEKTILFLDEFQWLAVNQSRLVSLIKFYWDRHWRKQKVMLILCGSVSSFMVKRVINSNALYGRISFELCLQPFMPHEIHRLLKKKRNSDESLLYSLTLGGIPKYLEEVNVSFSFDQNINRLCFTHNGLLVKEYERIFYSQFKEHKTYEVIVKFLANKPLSLDEISYVTKIPTGGGLKSYLSNLEKAAFITSYVPYDKALNSRLIKYRLTDEYLRFYFKFIFPNLKLIATNKSRNIFTQHIKPKWQSWLGFAFENFCLKNAEYLAEKMGFSDQVLQWGPLFSRDSEGFQVDLIYFRQDNVITLCEAKCLATPVGIDIVREVDKKCRLLTIPRGYTLEKALISRFGANDELKKLNYFNYIVDAQSLFQC